MSSCFINKTEIKESFLKQLKWKLYFKTNLAFPTKKYKEFLAIKKRSNEFIADCPDRLSKSVIYEHTYGTELSVYLEDSVSRKKYCRVVRLKKHFKE